MDNVHPETQISFGVVSAQNVSDLWNEILENGTDLEYQATLKEMETALKQCRTVEAVNKIVERESTDEDNLVEDLNFDASKLARKLLEDYESDEVNYVYEKGEYRYQLRSGGGVHYIIVCQSPFVAHCRQCSPCYPNAGNLDEITDGGMVAYCFNPEDYDGMPRPHFNIRQPVFPRRLAGKQLVTVPDED